MKFLKYYKENDDDFSRYKKETANYISNRIKNLSYENFTQREIDQIKKLRSSSYVNNFYNYKSTVSIENYQGYITMDIRKYYDEIYTIKDYLGNWYICDGIKGVLNCLQMIIKNAKITESVNHDRQYKTIDVYEWENKTKNLHREHFTNHEIDTLINTGVRFQTKMGYAVSTASTSLNFATIYKYYDEVYVIYVNATINTPKSIIILCDGFKGVLNFIDDNKESIFKNK